ncbi:ligand-binding protein SH3 [Alkalibaculum sp. M08DMB]|uniref:Ligand-binding protein SH3 n=1 Tax=Alkalibaculum sporogenes TaxID=2655001 RepID=A0A6A7K7Q7_9FIRM|nr:small multi-drug export protein [Alkalibaculum sporogenes]MPW25425.1 ligand-binding protein SH3 [Alkalibaculum sporogenes]
MIEFLSNFPDWLKILISSAVPIFELRFSIPFGILLLEMPYINTYVLAVIGSIIPAPFILWLIPSILEWMKGTKIFGKLGNWIYDLGMKKSEVIDKYSFWSLVMFIAIPLPGTGVWTGCLAASLMRVKFKKGLLAAFIGSSIAGIAMIILSSVFGMAIL